MADQLHPIAWTDTLPYKGTSKAVLLALATFAGKQGRCWPSLDALSTRSGCARSTVALRLKELKKAGIIEQRRRHKGGTMGSLSNVYQLRLDYRPRTPKAQATGHSPTAKEHLAKMHATTGKS